MIEVAKKQQIRQQIACLKVATRGPSFVSRKYGADMLRQIRFLEQRLSNASC